VFMYDVFVCVLKCRVVNACVCSGTCM